MADLIALSDLKLRLGVPAADTSQDAALSALIGQVSALVESHIGPVLLATYTSYLDGTGSQFLTLPRGRVQSVSAVYVDENASYGAAEGAFPAGSALEATEYALVNPAGVLYRVGFVWPRPWVRYRGDLTGMPRGPLFGSGNIKVVYQAGYTVAPLDLQMAVADVIALARAGAGKGGTLNNESYDGYSYSLGGLDTSRAWQGYLSGAGGAILARHRRLAV